MTDAVFDFSMYRFNLLAISKASAAIFYVCLGFYIWLKDRKSAVHVALFLISLATGTWLLFGSALEMLSGPELVPFYSNWMHCGIAFIPPSTYFLAKALVGEYEQKRRVIWINYGVCLALLILFLVNPGHLMMRKEAQLYSWGYFPRFGWLYYLFLIQFARLMVLTIAAYAKAYRRTTNLREKNRMKYALMAFFVAYLGAVDFLPAAGLDVYPWGGFPSLLYIGILAYVIAYHRLMNIETVALRTAVWAAASLLALVPTGLALLELHPWLTRLSKHQMTGALLLAFAAFALGWIEIQKKVDQRLQKRMHDLRQVLAGFLAQATALKSLDEMAGELVRVLTGRLYVDGAALYVRARPDVYNDCLEPRGDDGASGKFLRRDDPFAQWLQERDEVLSLPELEKAAAGDPHLRRSVQSFFEQQGRPELIAPFRNQEGLLGWIGLGPKSDGGGFRAAELEFLDQLRQGLAVIISNSLLYDRVREFNQNLEGVVRKRTQDLEELNGELVRSRDRVVHAERLAAIGKLASGVGHELRNPLGAISNAIYYVVEAVRSSDALKEDVELMQMLGLADREIKVANAIISDLLDFTRDLKLVPEPTDLNELLRNARSVAFLPPEVRFVERFDPGLPTLMVDPQKMRQVFVNIINNAAQAMPEGGTLTVSTTALDDDEASWVEIGFRDTGVGIAAENMKNLFEPLFTTKAKGTGLGLSISRNIVQGHGGTIRIESKLGHGAEVRLRFPVR